jgi:hypothetical protein
LAKMQAQGMQMDSFNLTSNEDLLGKIWPWQCSWGALTRALAWNKFACLWRGSRQKTRHCLGCS